MFQLRWVWTRMAGCHRRYVFALFSTAALAVLALGNSMITARIMDTVFYPLQESGHPGGNAPAYCAGCRAGGLCAVPHGLWLLTDNDVRDLLPKAHL